MQQEWSFQEGGRGEGWRRQGGLRGAGETWQRWLRGGAAARVHVSPVCTCVRVQESIRLAFNFLIIDSEERGMEGESKGEKH